MARAIAALFRHGAYAVPPGVTGARTPCRSTATGRTRVDAGVPESAASCIDAFLSADASTIPAVTASPGGPLRCITTLGDE